jgi:hypothetical protein
MLAITGYATSDGGTFAVHLERLLKFTIHWGDIGFTIVNFTTANLDA